MVDFHGEVTFISGFDGIRDIFEARFVMNLCFQQFKCDIYNSDVTIDRDRQRYVQKPCIPVYDWIKKLHEISVIECIPYYSN
jgi:hypothetical protein